MRRLLLSDGAVGGVKVVKVGRDVWKGLGDMTCMSTMVIYKYFIISVYIYTLMFFTHVKIHTDKVTNLYAHRNLRNPF